jgi:protein-disulfide isomerase
MAGSVRPAKDQGPTVTLSKNSGGKGPGGKGNQPKKPYVNQSRARLEAQRKQRNRKVMIGVLVVVVVGIIAGVVIASTGGSSKAKPVVAPPAASGPTGTFTTGTGPVLVEQYGDFQCPHCEAWFQDVEPTVRTLASQNKITFAYHVFPFIGAESFSEANAAACASDAAPGDFWKMHDYLYQHQAAENSGFWTTSQLEAALSTVVPTTPALDQCIKSDKYGAWVKQQATAAAKRQVTATPTVFVNNQLVSDNSTPAPLVALITAAAKK